MRVAVAVMVAACVSSCAVAPGESPGGASPSSYVVGGGTIVEFQADARGEPLTVSGKDTDGQAVDTSAWSGTPVVLNVWYSSCGPCRAEAPDLTKLATEFKGKAQFVGVNSRDTAQTASAFEDTFNVTYPSIIDDGGQAMAALSGQVPGSAVPLTLVLDRQGRIASRVIGRADPSALKSLITTVVDEAE